jgi:erythromycin esterase
MKRFLPLLGIVLACSDAQAPTSDPAEVQVPPVPPEIVTWLQANVVPFTTADPSTAPNDHSDLEPLRDMIGDARVVALGEATHGTREFFQMKHRVLAFLVEEMDFNIFAIEATWPEANRLNEYVHAGQGNPETLLSGLYFWTWNTEEVLDMILWMRQHNVDPGSAPAVSFFGFDMQFPGMAIHNVLQFLEPLDAVIWQAADGHYDCMEPYANDPTGARQASYGQAEAAYQNACRDAVQAVYDSLAAHQTAYEGMSSPAAFAKALRSARIVVQYEDMEAERTVGGRDLYMAENSIWLLEQGGPDAKIVLWAHNGHVSNRPGWMGSHLQEEYGDDLVVVGFDFYHGSFRAVTYLGGGSYGSLTTHSVVLPPLRSYEYYYHSAGVPRFILDLQGINFSTSATSWLPGPRQMRSIGAVFQPGAEHLYFYDARQPEEYDLIIYFEGTTVARGLPYQPPGSW